MSKNIGYYIDLNQPGVIFDGAFGQEFNDHRLIELASSCGFDAGDLDSVDVDDMYYVVSDALDFLNDHIGEQVPEQDRYLEWHEGDLRLSFTYEDEEV